MPPIPPITVAAADLANVWVRGGQAGGTETMWVRAFDGTDWSGWDSFTFTTLANTPPVATINDHSLHTNEWSQVKNWLSYSDADGNAATQYQFWDEGRRNSGYFWTPGNAHGSRYRGRVAAPIWQRLGARRPGNGHRNHVGARLRRHQLGAAGTFTLTTIL